MVAHYWVPPLNIYDHIWDMNESGSALGKNVGSYQKSSLKKDAGGMYSALVLD